MGVILTLSTTAKMLYATSGRRTFVVEADEGNSTNLVEISTTQDMTSFITLKPGQQESFNNWSGTLYAKASANTPIVYVELENEGIASLSKSAGA